MANAIVSGVVGGLGLLQGHSAMKSQEKAQRADWESKINTAEYNIERSREEARVLTGDIQREGAQFSRGQMAAMGASGAEVGGGTPLMNMLQTQAGIARDVLNVQRASEMEIEFYEEEIETYEGLLPKKEPMGERRHKGTGLQYPHRKT